MHDYRGQQVTANYWRGSESVGGQLGFDDTGMTFNSHQFNVQTGGVRIEYRNIVRLDTYRTLGLVNNGLTVYTRDGAAHKFVISRRGQIIDFLGARIPR